MKRMRQTLLSFVMLQLLLHFADGRTITSTTATIPAFQQHRYATSTFPFTSSAARSRDAAAATASASVRGIMNRPSCSSLQMVKIHPFNTESEFFPLQEDDDDDDGKSTTAEGQGNVELEDDDTAAAAAAAAAFRWPDVDWERVLEVAIPLATPFLAFESYNTVAKSFEWLVEVLSSNSRNWVAVDGGAYQAKIIAPAINGVVLPAIAILFATLTSTTISTLRQRQVDVRKSINMEAGELRVMEYLVNSFPSSITATTTTSFTNNYQLSISGGANGSSSSPSSRRNGGVAGAKVKKSLVPNGSINNNKKNAATPASVTAATATVVPPPLLDPPAEFTLQDRFRNYLIQYTSRIIGESQPHHCFHSMSQAGADINPRRGMDSELNAILQLLNEHYHEIPTHLAQEAYQSVARLREYRHARITALQSTYPTLHYISLAVLAIAQCTGFLIETNQELLFFLNAVQLKILWSMLVGTFVSCFTVFYDLGSPFAGSYQISASVDQLYTVRMALEASAKLHQQELQAARRQQRAAAAMQQEQEERFLQREQQQQQQQLELNLQEETTNGSVMMRNESL